MGPPLPSAHLDAPARASSARTGPSVALFLATLATYWPTLFHRFGFRDDYPLLQEALAEPGKILAVCASQGRLFYGLVLELAMRSAGNIDGLRWVRFASAIGLGLLAGLLFAILTRIGWQRWFAAMLAFFLVLMPSAQVLVSWATCVPQVFALLSASAAFALIECRKGDGARRSLRVLDWAGAIVLMAAAALTYQSNALFYLVLVTAALVVRRDEPFAHSFRWLVRHAIVTGAGLVGAFGLMNLSFSLGLFRRSPRIRFEDDLLWKLEWWVREVLPDALAQPLVGGEPGAGATAYWLMIGGVLFFILAGVLLAFQSHRRRGRLWLLGLATLPLSTFAISIVAAERWPTYRSIYPLTGVFTVFLVASLWMLSARVPARWRHARTLALAGLTVFVALHARNQALEMIALPQGRELAVMEEGADRLKRAPSRWVYVITATQSDTSAPHRYRDEFGAVSLDAGWIIRDVLTLLMREREHVARGSRPYDQFMAGPIDPIQYVYDVIIDLRRIASFRNHRAR